MLGPWEEDVSTPGILNFRRFEGAWFGLRLSTDGLSGDGGRSVAVDWEPKSMEEDESEMELDVEEFDPTTLAASTSGLFNFLLSSGLWVLGIGFSGDGLRGFSGIEVVTCSG